MSQHRSDKHTLVVFWEKLDKDLDKLDFRLGLVRGKRWRQVKKAEDERMFKK